jgi:hypothetical protein
VIADVPTWDEAHVDAQRAQREVEMFQAHAARAQVKETVRTGRGERR